MRRILLALLALFVLGISATAQNKTFTRNGIEYGQEIQRYVTQRSANVSAYSVQKELNVLKHLLRLSVDWEVIPFYPADKVRSPKVPDGRVRYLQPAELRVVTAACPDWLRPIVILAVNTGRRRSEILKLRWLDYDAATNRLTLHRTKNGSDRMV